ncbi:PREDICTED: uncharacterized protein LOC109227835 [Nicotiana attenuata]|uniref:uncharacterized protein LOC109227835 n=1 Tax=Nicotiana attenuata TaxID=49451 RepID=UPI0009056470|nr:PREDICTED: uncharacterized protein LOC109227835 [Nicotiana attenuata]
MAVELQLKFSPLSSQFSHGIRALVSIATKKNREIFQLDVNNAFLHGDLNEEVYMQVPPGLSVDKQNLVCKLNKSLVGNSVVFVAVYVDDVLLTGIYLEEIKALKTFLHATFKIKDLGRLYYFLGLEILYKHDGVIITQRKFTRDLIQEFECSHCTPMSSPIDPSTKLKADEGNLLTNPTKYRKLVGKLNFLTNTRLDIAYSVQHLSQYMQSPRDSHLKAAMHVLRYLKGDPDWAACPETRKSVSGFIALLGDSPFSWKSKKQSTVSLSSAEAEYKSARKAVAELIWLSKLLEELTMPLTLPIPIYCDEQAALHIARNPVFHERTKHIEVDCHFVRDKLIDGLISLHYVHTDDQLADILTKSLTGIKHSSLLYKWQ